MNRKLKARIVENFESQANFSQIVKCDESFISRIVRGRRSLSVEIQKKWADALGCELKCVFHRIGMSNPE